MKKNPITVYWAPFDSYWNMLYPDPDIVINNLFLQKNKNSGKRSFFACPSFRDKLSKTYAFKFPIDASYEWDFSNFENPIFKPTSEIFLNTDILRPPTINNSPQVGFALDYLFFCEESLPTTFSAPYFSEPNYMNHAAVAPGTMDIGQWFRGFPIEMTFWKESGNIKFKANEHLFYVEFLTDRPIVLKRFVTNQRIKDYATACTNSSRQMVANVPLIERYTSFKNSKMNKLIIKEIKENLI